MNLPLGRASCQPPRGGSRTSVSAKTRAATRFAAAETDHLIDLWPDCPRWASSRVDRLLVAIEALVEVEL